MLWYNADLFRKHGVQPPTSRWTFDDMLEAARRLTIPDQGQWGIVNGGPVGSWIMPSYLGPWGGFWVDDTETKTGITNSGSLAAMQFWMDLFFKHKVAPVPGTTSGDPYVEGKAAMVFGGPWTYRGWIGRISFESPIADWPIGPTGKRISASMGSGYPITVNSKYRDEAWLYSSEFLGKDMNRSLMGQFVQTGLGTPVRFSIMKEFEKSQFAMPNVQIVAPAASYSVIGRPISPIKPELDKVWTEERAKLLRQDVSVKDMLETVARRIQPFLDQNKGWDAAR
jgi:multiple sugar transport system substrate-binding protein